MNTASETISEQTMLKAEQNFNRLDFNTRIEIFSQIFLKGIPETAKKRTFTDLITLLAEPVSPRKKKT